MIRAAAAALALSALAACNPGEGSFGAPGDKADTQPFKGIGPNEVVQFAGTEPFWGGRVAGTSLTYSTPENAAGQVIAVTRFAGRNGVSFSGTLDNQEFVLSVSAGDCSDGMSDRGYPFHATLKVRGETRRGCAWSTAHPVSGPPTP